MSKSLYCKARSAMSVVGPVAGGLVGGYWFAVYYDDFKDCLSQIQAALSNSGENLLSGSGECEDIEDEECLCPPMAPTPR